VAHIILDELPPYPGPFLRSISIVPDEDSLGRVMCQARLWPDLHSRPQKEELSPKLAENAVIAARYDIVELLAGPIAELYCRHGWFSPLMSRDECVRLIRSGEGADGSDQRRVDRLIDWLAVPAPEPYLTDLFDIAYALVATEWAGIVRVARVLQSRNVMSGDEFETAWRSMRAAEAPRRAERHLGTNTWKWRDRLATIDGGVPA
jgi:hypothetical protein